MAAIRRPVPDERCVVRYRLPDGSATDLIGVLVDIDGDGLVISPRPAELVTIDHRDVVALKVVPEIPRGRAPTRTSPAELEHLAALGWVAQHQPLGEWWLRAAGGFTGRANSACAVGDPGLPLPAAAAAVIDFAGAHGIAPLAQTITGSAEDAGLRSLGWRETYVRTDVLVHRLSELVGTRPVDPTVAVSTDLDDAWLAAFGRYRSYEVADDVVREVLSGPGSTVGLGAVRDHDHPAHDHPDPAMVSIGRAHVAGGWVGVSALWTDPRQRRAGRATAVLVALGRWAARRGARNVYLQVAQGNSAAQQAYGRLGFVPHHTYRYLRPPT